MMCCILIVAGLPGSGKTSVSTYISRIKKIPIVSMGQLTETILEKKRLPINEEGEKEVRQHMRATYGADIYAQTVLPTIKKTCKTHRVVILEGVKSEEELKVITQICSHVQILYLDVTAPIRYRRLLTRSKRKLTRKEAEKRDIYERNILQENKLREQADFLIQNEGTKEELYKQCETIWRKIDICTPIV